MRVFFAGLLVMGYSVAALFFLRFRQETGDRLFAFFAAAFGLLALQRVLLTTGPRWGVDEIWYYVMRLLAFLLIIIAIADKNRAR